MSSSFSNTEYPKNFASLQEISKLSHVSYQTLNYYTSLGLLKSEKREGNKRLYLISDVKERLETITKLKNEGYPLRVISNLLNNGSSSLHQMQGTKYELF